MAFTSAFSYEEYPSMDFETNQHNYEPVIEWNSLDKYLEWQQDQPDFSSPDSPLSDADLASSFGHQSFHIDNPVAWAEITPGNMLPTSRISTPQNASYPGSMNGNENTTPYSIPLGSMSGNEDSMVSSPPPGPQLPKIGRPRSTATSVPAQDLEGGKAPTQARRRSQNREAQRAFRLRQKQYIDQIALENKELIGKNTELEARCEMLAKAYHRVLSANSKMGGVGAEQRGGIEPGRGSGEFGMPWMQNGLC